MTWASAHLIGAGLLPEIEPFEISSAVIAVSDALLRPRSIKFKSVAILLPRVRIRPATLDRGRVHLFK
jgi:hypothetical protein